MKKLLLFVAAFLIMALPTVAQETDLSEEEFKQKIDSVFEHVDMTSVETGILIEHGFNLLDPNVFNGQKPDSVYSNKEIMKALYAGLYDSRVNDYFSLEDTDSTFSKIDNAKNISILFLAYNRFKDYMFKSGDIYWENGQLKKTDNSKWENLFDYDFCFAVALGKDEFVGNEVTIPINVDNLLNNTMSRISQIDVKADDGTYEKVALNTDWKHTFSQLGEHWLTFRVLFYDGFSYGVPHPNNAPRTKQPTPSANRQTNRNIYGDCRRWRTVWRRTAGDLPQQGENIGQVYPPVGNCRRYQPVGTAYGQCFNVV